MRRNFLIAAILFPLGCFLLFKFQDGDFTLIIYEKIGQDPAVALRGKVVWITGASSGIGEYLAYELVKYGCKLVLSARRKAELDRVKKNCAAIAIAQNSSFKTDNDILVLPLDLLKYDTHEKLTQDVLTQLEKGYFDTARLELAEHNIHVQTVLPGPVESNLALHYFTENINDEHKGTQKLPKLEMMSTERCAKLMATGMANNLDEVWITENPLLLMLYMNQYFPNLYRWFSKKFLMERIGRLKKDKTSSSEDKKS